MIDLITESKALQDELIAIRRQIHKNPELGMKLPATTALVREKLTAMGYQVKDVGPSGLSVTVGKGDKCFLLRADMDALPVTEDTDLDFKSTNGAMHACGHDLHTAMLLGAAKLLKAHEAEIKGVVKLMFQPGEETLEGAKSMVAEGILENPRVDAAAMFHVAAGFPMPTGIILVPGGGAFSSASDSFEITIRGKGGHGAMPDQCVDPLLVASHLYQALQTIVSREVVPAETAIITVGMLHAGEANNVIPETALLKGTIRTYNNDVRKFILERVPALARSIAESFRAKAEPLIIEGCPSVIIDPKVAADVRASLADLFGATVVDPAKLGFARLGGSEDFSFITQKVPSVMMMLNAGSPEEGYAYSMHHPRAKYNEAVLSQGAAAYAATALGWLEKNG
ncbi:peptidase [Spirochaetia bacterium]|nr:peptidase [Spirochaetia bacterium]GHV49761.1 peptidase [Spirochaetia bacterium]